MYKAGPAYGLACLRAGKQGAYLHAILWCEAPCSFHLGSYYTFNINDINHKSDLGDTIYDLFNKKQQVNQNKLQLSNRTLIQD